MSLPALSVTIFLIVIIFISLFLNFLFFRKASSRKRVLILALLLMSITVFSFGIFRLLTRDNISDSCTKIVTGKIDYLVQLYPDNSEYQNSKNRPSHINDPLYSNLYMICLKEKGSSNERVIEYQSTPHYLNIWNLH